MPEKKNFGTVSTIAFEDKGKKDRKGSEPLRLPFPFAPMVSDTGVNDFLYALQGNNRGDYTRSIQSIMQLNLQRESEGKDPLWIGSASERLNQKYYSGEIGMAGAIIGSINPFDKQGRETIKAAWQDETWDPTGFIVPSLKAALVTALNVPAIDMAFKPLFSAKKLIDKTVGVNLQGWHIGVDYKEALLKSAFDNMVYEDHLGQYQAIEGIKDAVDTIGKSMTRATEMSLTAQDASVKIKKLNSLLETMYDHPMTYSQGDIRMAEKERDNYLLLANRMYQGIDLLAHTIDAQNKALQAFTSKQLPEMSKVFAGLYEMQREARENSELFSLFSVGLGGGLLALVDLVGMEDETAGQIGAFAWDVTADPLLWVGMPVVNMNKFGKVFAKTLPDVSKAVALQALDGIKAIKNDPRRFMEAAKFSMKNLEGNIVAKTSGAINTLNNWARGDVAQKVVRNDNSFLTTNMRKFASMTKDGEIQKALWSDARKLDEFKDSILGDVIADVSRDTIKNKLKDKKFSEMGQKYILDILDGNIDNITDDLASRYGTGAEALTDFSKWNFAGLSEEMQKLLDDIVSKDITPGYILQGEKAPLTVLRGEGLLKWTVRVGIKGISDMAATDKELYVVLREQMLNSAVFSKENMTLIEKIKAVTGPRNSQLSQDISLALNSAEEKAKFMSKYKNAPVAIEAMTDARKVLDKWKALIKSTEGEFKVIWREGKAQRYRNFKTIEEAENFQMKNLKGGGKLVSSVRDDYLPQWMSNVASKPGASSVDVENFKDVILNSAIDGNFTNIGASKFFLNPRKLDNIENLKNLDVVDLLMTYEKVASHQMFIKPTFAKAINEATKAGDDTLVGNRNAAYDRFIKRRGGFDTELGEIVREFSENTKVSDKPIVAWMREAVADTSWTYNPITTAMRRIASFGYFSYLGFSLPSALKNLTQTVNTFVATDFDSATRALVNRMLPNSATKNFWRMYAELSGTVGIEALYGKPGSSIFRPLQSAGMAMFQGSEDINRSIAMMAGMEARTKVMYPKITQLEKDISDLERLRHTRGDVKMQAQKAYDSVQHQIDNLVSQSKTQLEELNKTLTHVSEAEAATLTNVAKIHGQILELDKQKLVQKLNVMGDSISEIAPVVREVKQGFGSTVFDDMIKEFDSMFDSIQKIDQEIAETYVKATAGVEPKAYQLEKLPESLPVVKQLKKMATQMPEVQNALKEARKMFNDVEKVYKGKVKALDRKLSDIYTAGMRTQEATQFVYGGLNKRITYAGAHSFQAVTDMFFEFTRQQLQFLLNRGPELKAVIKGEKFSPILSRMIFLGHYMIAGAAVNKGLEMLNVDMEDATGFGFLPKPMGGGETTDIFLAPIPKLAVSFINAAGSSDARKWDSAIADLEKLLFTLQATRTVKAVNRYATGKEPHFKTTFLKPLVRKLLANGEDEAMSDEYWWNKKAENTLLALRLKQLPQGMLPELLEINPEFNRILYEAGIRDEKSLTSFVRRTLGIRTKKDAEYQKAMNDISELIAEKDNMAYLMYGIYNPTIQKPKRRADRRSRRKRRRN